MVTRVQGSCQRWNGDQRGGRDATALARDTVEGCVLNKLKFCGFTNSTVGRLRPLIIAESKEKRCIQLRSSKSLGQLGGPLPLQGLPELQMALCSPPISSQAPHCCHAHLAVILAMGRWRVCRRPSQGARHHILPSLLPSSLRIAHC